MTDSVVLILSTNAEIARILHDLLRHSGHEVHIDDGTEPLREVLDRVQPRLALIDIDHQDGFAPAFIDKLHQRGIAIVAFSPSRYESEVRQRAAPRHLAFFGLPLRVNRFREVLHSALEAPESSD